MSETRKEERGENSQPSNGSPFWSNIFKKDDRYNYDIINILREVPIFSTLSKREIKKVSLIVYERVYKEGEFLFKEGNPGAGMYIIQDGVINIESSSQSDNLVLATLGRGDFLGELSLLDETSRSATARCIKQTRVIVFFRQDLFDLIEREPILGVKILKELAMMIGARLRETNKLLHRYKNREFIESQE